MNSQVVVLMDVYRDNPIKIQKKKVSFFKERKMREESKQIVNRAVNQWLYEGLFKEVR